MSHLKSFSNTSLAPSVETILTQALEGEDISPEAALCLLQQQQPATWEKIRFTANTLRQQQAGEIVTYIINRNINFTNICEQHCSFCAFRRDEGEVGAFWLEKEQILAKTAEAVERGATEICMQGGLNPTAKLDGASLPYYLQLVETIKNNFPQLHLHSFSPQEVQFIAREDRLSYAEVITALQKAGVGSMPELRQKY